MHLLASCFNKLYLLSASMNNVKEMIPFNRKPFESIKVEQMPGSHLLLLSFSTLYKHCISILLKWHLHMTCDAVYINPQIK